MARWTVGIFQFLITYNESTYLIIISCMNSESDTRFISERRVWSQKAKAVSLASALAVVCGAVIVYFVYLTYQPPVIAPTGYGLNAEQLLDTTPYGYLLLTANVKNDETVESQVLKYDFSDSRFTTDSVGSAPESLAVGDYQVSMRQVATGDTTGDLGAVLVTNTQSGEAIEIPGSEQYQKSDLAVSSVGEYVAYGYTTRAVGENEFVSESSVLLYNMLTTESIILSSASEPFFNKNGTKILYLGVDGIYEYDLAVKTSTRVFITAPNITLADDLAASLDSRYIVLTSPTKNQIKVAVNVSGDTTVFSEIGAVITPGTIYNNPVIAEDGRMYAVQSGPSTIEVRSVENAEVLNTISLSEVSLADNVKLTTWVTPGSYIINQDSESDSNIGN